MIAPPEGWEARGRPVSWFRRFAFTRYAETRDFLDEVAALSDALNLHPQNINFAATYANITLEGAERQAPGEAELAFALRVNALAASRAGR